MRGGPSPISSPPTSSAAAAAAAAAATATAAAAAAAESRKADVNNNWGPYANAGDFKGNALIILSAIFCAVLVFLAVNSIFRFLICASCCSGDEHHQQQQQQQQQEGGAAAADGSENSKKRVLKSENINRAVVVYFSKDGNYEMGGSAAECAICLSEFEQGEGITVLPSCHHGFHVTCLDSWLALRCSCPTCRTKINYSINIDPPPPPPSMDHHHHHHHNTSTTISTTRTDDDDDDDDEVVQSV